MSTGKRRAEEADDMKFGGKRPRTSTTHLIKIGCVKKTDSNSDSEEEEAESVVDKTDDKPESKAESKQEKKDEKKEKKEKKDRKTRQKEKAEQQEEEDEEYVESVLQKDDARLEETIKLALEWVNTNKSAATDMATYLGAGDKQKEAVLKGDKQKEDDSRAFLKSNALAITALGCLLMEHANDLQDNAESKKFYQYAETCFHRGSQLHHLPAMYHLGLLHSCTSCLLLFFSLIFLLAGDHPQGCDSDKGRAWFRAAMEGGFDCEEEFAECNGIRF